VCESEGVTARLFDFRGIIYGSESECAILDDADSIDGLFGGRGVEDVVLLEVDPRAVARSTAR